MPYYIYILLCEGNRYYTGITTDPARRLLQHRGTLPGGAKSMRALRPICFAAVWKTETKSAALSLEAHIKHLTHTQKEELVRGASLQPLDLSGYERTALNDDKSGLADTPCNFT